LTPLNLIKYLVEYPFVQLPCLSIELELCAAAPTPPTECRRSAGAVFVKCSRHVAQQLYVATVLQCRLQWIFNIDKKQ